MFGRLSGIRVTKASGVRASRRFVALVGAVALVAVLIGVIACGPSAGTDESSAASGASGHTASAPAAMATGTAGRSSPTDASTSAPPASSGPIVARVVETVYCGPMGEVRLVFSGTAMFANCGREDGASDLREFNGAGQTVFSHTVTDAWNIVSDLEEDNGVWFSNAFDADCTHKETYTCPPHAPHVRRIDMATGEITFNLDGMYLAGDGLGYLWASPTEGQMTIPGSGPLTKIDPVSLRTSTIPWAYGQPEVACGGLWGLTLNVNAGTDATTTITRVDPATGSALATFTEPGYISDLAQTSDGCWATASGIPPWRDFETSHTRYVKIGLSGVESRSPLFEAGLVSADEFFVLNGGFWVQSGHVGARTLQRLDPATWNRVGPNYLLPAFPWEFTCAGGSIWVGQLDDQNKAILQKLDIPLG